MVKDPVCGMMVDPAQSKYQSQYKGEKYVFCGPGCKVSFDKAPERYIAKQPAATGAGKPQ